MLCGTSNSSMHPLFSSFKCDAFFSQVAPARINQQSSILTCAVQFDPVNYILAQLISNTLTSNSIYIHNLACREHMTTHFDH